MALDDAAVTVSLRWWARPLLRLVVSATRCLPQRVRGHVTDWAVIVVSQHGLVAR